jgi:thiamine biosynthesis lipoprotein
MNFSFCASGYLLLVVFFCGCQQQQIYRDNRLLMGTVVEVASPDARAAGIVFKEVSRLEHLLSKYRPESEVAKLNRLGELMVSRELFFIIKRAKEFSQASSGVFDITVGPLVELWGFTDKKYRLPEPEEIKKTLALVGAEKIILQQDNSVVKFKTLGMKIGLGGIAKGYALDCAVRKLKEARINSCLINVGGQVYGLGDRFGKPWRVAIKGPRQAGFAGYLGLKEQSVATSGDYQQYFIKAKRRYSHIINPKSGYPADSGVISVTIVAPDGLTADVLSTAIFVLGEAEGRRLVKKFPGAEIKAILTK